MIETLSDVVTELADRLGIYGSCQEEDAQNPGHENRCRPCFEISMTTRIKEAVRISRIMEAAALENNNG